MESAASRSESSHTIAGECPPSSKVHLFSPEDARLASCLPTGTDPVKLTFLTISEAKNFFEKTIARQ